MGERSKQGKGPKNSIYSLFNIGLKEKKKQCDNINPSLAEPGYALPKANSEDPIQLEPTDLYLNSVLQLEFEGKRVPGRTLLQGHTRMRVPCVM